MGISSSEILSTAEKKAVLGGWGPWYGNPCVSNGPVKCYKTNNPADRYFYCDMQSCLATCGVNAGPYSVCG